KTCCKQEEAEFLKGLKLLAELQHDNIVGLRGFCCSRARGECFLVHDFVPNGSLSHFLDVAGEDGGGGALGHGGRVLEWSTRVSIIKGIAKEELDICTVLEQTSPLWFTKTYRRTKFWWITPTSP
uniref:Serine-threonine/tyrosine-protein kinase catalytic domain-containing protein n=1 Tax=Aegilops tauschii subsp. strangulata TaxID=200361 RepID=A0A453EY82_AEGTS